MPIPDHAIHTSDAAGRTQPIDLAHLDMQTCGDPSLQGELLTLFRDQAHAILRDLAALGDPIGGEAAVRRHAADLCHRLCGSARAIGAWEVADIAERLERASRPRPADPPATGSPEVLPLTAAMLAAVERAVLTIETLRTTLPAIAMHDDATRR